MTITKIISGGQTGADQGALHAARELSLATGGTMPRNWRTDIGPMPELGIQFGLVQHGSDQYAPRTYANVEASDACVIIGNLQSPGCRLTRNYALTLRKPLYHAPWRTPAAPMVDERFQQWLIAHAPAVLNVAGNRERVNVGIFNFTRRWLVANITAARTTSKDLTS